MKLIDRLQNEVLVGDGAIGTMLYTKGIGLEVNFEHLNIIRPQLVLELHQEYLSAGAQVLETNTFGANRSRLQAIGLEAKVAEINRRGAAIARQAAGDQALVAGSIGPLARLKGEEKLLQPDEQRAIFLEQATALAEGGVDLLLLETFSDLDQAVIAVAAAKATGLPVIASMAYVEGGRTAAGFTVEQVASSLTAAGADVIGANCGAGPLELLRIVERLAKATTLPLSAYPNSGFPEFVDGRHIYRCTPEYFAGMAAEMAAGGATLVGGCCGTTPEHIRAVALRLKGAKPSPRVVISQSPAAKALDSSEPLKSGFLADWGKRPIITVELDPPPGMAIEKVLAGSQALKSAGADAINLAENPLARVRVGNIALGSMIQREVEIEVIPHITCRDRNLLGLQSDLMGASLLGLRNILAVTGDPARLGDQAGASSVYDLNSFELIKLIKDLNNGVNAVGNSIGTGTGFTIGCAFNPNSPKMAVQVTRLEKKLANGAQFVQTQPIYEQAVFDAMLEQTAHLGIPILPGILPLVSERNCEYLHNEVPGIVIPDEIRTRMKGKEKEAGVAEGVRIAKEFITAARHKVGGFYLIPPFGRYAIAAELIRFIREGK
ncbi:bifunctional homocysteine S-methyltransferase/methylenetetrahydrofolate reductase [Geobacter pelophilus]|uniref:Bifunctional homocysteine S-methyltransferase/methylenetetrahydrofolate reductase n=1 Tax=Geoanaerobacter pelophilus TaxID=60036 RepID=A0AAW4KZR5_9BACT|nr:bifunctional homocysteine S-methyltransferase/methylenetetrahydrofolate reductase [Geoanaerobacter pelophilus]MBT0663884.1 bifunctional homocysteine S-methyltransferase/methylenetetrahydrofolate reductase [Geoanaerobacter pelophilus]